MIELKGETRTYHLDYASMNALCRLEEITGQPFEEVMRELRGTKARPVTARAFVAAALVDPPETLEAVDAILDDIGGLAVIRRAVRTATTPRRPRRKGR